MVVQRGISWILKGHLSPKTKCSIGDFSVVHWCHRPCGLLLVGILLGTHAACLLIPDIPGVWVRVRVGLDTTGFVQSCTQVSHRGKRGSGPKP